MRKRPQPSLPRGYSERYFSNSVSLLAVKFDSEEDIKNYELFELYSSVIHSVPVTLNMMNSKYPLLENQGVFL